MAIDPSIYQNVKSNPVQLPDIGDAANKAMTLSQMALTNRQNQLAMQTQQATRDAYQKNTDPNGNLNQQAFLSDLGRVNPQASLTYQKQFSEMNKSAADAKIAQLDSAQKMVDAVMPAMQYVDKASADQKPQVYNEAMKQLASQGVPMNNIPQDAQGNYIYDPTTFQQHMAVLKNTPQMLAQQKNQAEIAKTYADIGQAPAKLNAEMYGSRSPNAELTSQYDKQAQPIRQSQMAMNQMIDNYKNPSPQGDASLILNAFKIKFPTAPDVNSLEELSHSQAAPDTFKNAAYKALSGGLDQATRDNLMRDGASTFRANVDTLNGIKQRYQARAKAQNVNDSTLTAEPEIDKTYADAMGIQKNIGPYVPPSARGGIGSAISAAASKLMGLGTGQDANATQSKNSKPLTTQDAEAIFWANKNKNDPRAQQILKMHGEL